VGGNPHVGRHEVTDEEIRTLVSGSPTLGEEERRIVDEVLEADSLRLPDVMVPRTEVHFLRGRLPVNQAVKEVLEGRHSRYPVIGTSVDDIIGFVHIRAPFWCQQ
jgi:putative hemolysin